MTANYDQIGVNYDATRKADPGIVARLAAHLGIEPDRRYVDIACGTGNYTAALATRGGHWWAFDQSAQMLSEARPKSSRVAWDQCDVTQTPYGEDAFDAALCSLAIHHFPDLPEAFAEIARILDPAGRLVLFTATPEQMRGYWLFRYFPVMMEQSCEQMPALDVVDSALQQAGLAIEVTEPFFITASLEDLFLYSGKQRPEMYFSKAVRNGISSFHNFCTPMELDAGLASLKDDIDSGHFTSVKRECENRLGDYLIVVARHA